MTSSTRWQSAFTGTSTLIRLGLRRDRIRMGAWSILLAGLLYGIAHQWGWQACGQLASVLGSIKIASRGGQNHALSRELVAKIHREAFGSDPWQA